MLNELFLFIYVILYVYDGGFSMAFVGKCICCGEDITGCTGTIKKQQKCKRCLSLYKTIPKKKGV
ncbi:MAG: hypothetical protein GY793_10250 [Proteobacteria bacterium]|nr:hypothetical protein [Pseudomonadota bacterium]